MSASPQPDNRALRRWPPVPWEMLGRGVLIVFLVAACPVALHRVIAEKGGTDVPQFYEAGRYVLEHRDIQPTPFLKYYWPSLDVAWAGLAWMPLPVVTAVWYAMACCSWIGLLITLHRLLAPYAPSPLARHAALAAGLLMLPLALDHLCIGAFHILMIWLMVAGLARVSRGRSWSGGVLLGLGVWIKLLPLVGVGYLALKRKWLAAGVAIACAVTVDLALALPVFGPQRTWVLHVQWWQSQAQGATERALTDPAYIGEDRVTNQSPAVVLRRLLTHMGWDAFPSRNSVALTDLSGPQLRMVYTGLVALLGLGILFYCRRPGRSLDAAQWASEIALIALGTLWFSPVAWSYHFTAATPALAVIVARRAARPRLVWTVAVLWLAALASFGWPLARSFGAMLWTTLLVGAVLVWGRGRSGSQALTEKPGGEADGVEPLLRRAA
jgi:hypothetical protein